MRENDPLAVVVRSPSAAKFVAAGTNIGHGCLAAWNGGDPAVLFHFRRLLLEVGTSLSSEYRGLVRMYPQTRTNTA